MRTKHNLNMPLVAIVAEGFFSRLSFGVISFVPHSFRGQRDYAWLSLLMIQESDRLEGYGTEAYRAVEDHIFSDLEVKRIGTLLIPQFDASLRFAEKMGFERAGGPFKNKRGYGLHSFVKKRSQT